MSFQIFLLDRQPKKFNMKKKQRGKGKEQKKKLGSEGKGFFCDGLTM